VWQAKGINLRLHAGENVPGGLLAQRVRVRLHRQHPRAVASKDERIFPLQREAADDVTQRDILLPRLAPDQHVVQVIGVQPFALRRAHHDREQVAAFPVQPRPAAGEVHLQRVINVLLIYAKLAAQGGNVLWADHLAAVLPVVPDAARGRVAREDIVHLAGNQAQPVRVGAFNAHLNGAVAGGAKHHAFGAGVDLRIVSRDVLVHVARQGGDVALVVHAHHDLRIVAVLALSAVGQNKAHTSLTNG
jgi:hypothetical protein